MTTTVVARGSEWSSSTLHDGWGDNVTDEQVAELGKLAVTRFEDLAEAAGYLVDWLPSVSQVHGVDLDMYDDAGECILDDIRKQAIEEVWQAVIGDGGPMAAAVTRIFEEVTD